MRQEFSKLKDTRIQRGCLALNVLGWNINTLSRKLINLKMQLDDFVNEILLCENHHWKEENLRNGDLLHSPTFIYP